MKIDKSLVSGSTALLLLELLSARDMYGYQMIDALELRSNKVFTLKAGTLYPLLHTLEQQGAVEAYEAEEAETRQRRYYRLTDKGRTLLDDKKKEWNAYSNAVNAVLGGMSIVAAQ